MGSIVELAKRLNVDAIELNKILVKNNIFVSVQFGILDGFIDDDIYNTILELFKMRETAAKDIDYLLSIKGDTIPIKSEPYIYFLFDDNQIVYIGQSKQLLSRIQEHKNNIQKNFNSIAVIETPRNKLNESEQFYIYKFNPNLNLTKYNAIQIIDSILKVI